MKSRLYTGNLLHARLEPVQHRFEYPIYFYVFDLDELETLGREMPLFSYNRWNLISLYDRDYLERGEGSIREKLFRVLKAQNCGEGIGRVELVTGARFLGYVFNPVSFFYCYDAKGELACVVSQVNNTFGESHLYVTREPLAADGFLARYEAAKEFHVSPFFDRSGSYEFKFSKLAETAAIQVNLKKQGRYVLVSELKGKAKPLTRANLLKTLVRFPWDALLTVPRIHWQAAKLYFGKKQRVYKKPVPDSPMTIRTSPETFFQRLSRRIIEAYLAKIRRGRLDLVLPGGIVRSFGETRDAPDAVIRVQNFRFFTRLIRDAGIGLGEGYVAEDWDTPDLTAVLNLMIDNKPSFEAAGDRVLGRIGEWFGRLGHLIRRNTLRGSRKNIEEHYDLSNDFFQTFLDGSMMYSAAVFDGPDDTLEAAQQRKLQRILDKARISAGDHVLEIGCGWGAFAIKAARETGCRVTGITLSKEQLRLATERAREAGVSDRVEFRLCDYRHVEGQFDRIVSIEMLEAVGHEYLPVFFQTCERLLKPHGIIVLQTIAIPDQRYDSYRRGCDWIQKHIFPGGHLPSLTALTQVMTRVSRLFVEHAENIGVHYARTLAEWRIRFREQSARVEALGFDRAFRRKWEYYLCYCEAGFARRYLNDFQLVLTRAANVNLDGKGDQLYAAASKKG